MPRFFINEQNIKGEKIILFGEDANHVSHSLRMRVGDEITACDFFNYEYDCVIESFSSSEVVLNIVDKHPSENEPTLKVTLFQALPKSTKLELIIQKCVELGIHDIVPVLTSRCISRPDEKSGEKKTKRWNMISKEAAKQSGRGTLPEVHDTLSFKQALLEMQKSDVKFMCYELCADGAGIGLKEYLKSKLSDDVKTVSFFVGSEGGISPDEAELARSCGIDFVSLGKRILRTETAPLCVLSCIMYESDNME